MLHRLNVARERQVGTSWCHCQEDASGYLAPKDRPSGAPLLSTWSAAGADPAPTPTAGFLGREGTLRSMESSAAGSDTARNRGKMDKMA